MGEAVLGEAAVRRHAEDLLLLAEVDLALLADAAGVAVLDRVDGHPVAGLEEAHALRDVADLDDLAAELVAEDRGPLPVFVSSELAPK